MGIFASTQLPPLELCTAVFCLPFQNNKILLVDNCHRSWEMPGSHIETSDRDILTALKREVAEEASVSIVSPVLIGYRKIIASVEQKNEEGNGKYPFLFSASF